MIARPFPDVFKLEQRNDKTPQRLLETWLTQFPEDKSTEGFQNLTTISDRTPEEVLKLLTQDQVIFHHPEKRNAWARQSLAPYGIRELKQFSKIVYTGLSHYVSVNKTLDWINLDINEYARRFASRSGYSYRIPSVELTDKLGGGVNHFI